MNKRFLPLSIGLAFLLLVGGVVLFQVLQPQSGDAKSQSDKKLEFPPARVVVMAIEEHEVYPRQKIVGTIMPTRHSNVGSAASGRVEEFPKREGEFVKKGDVIAQLRIGIIQAEWKAAKAMAEAQEAEVQFMKNSWEIEKSESRASLGKRKAALDYLLVKQKRLFKLKQNVSQEEVDEVISLTRQAEESVKEGKALLEMLEEPRAKKIAQAEAKLGAARAEEERLKEQLDRHTIKAPFDGYITKEYTQEGEWALQGALIAAVAELGEVDVEISVLEDFITFFDVGEEVDVEVPALAGYKFKGKVISKNPQANPKTRTFPVKIRIPNQIQGNSVLLMAGMVAWVEVPSAAKTRGLLVPRDALVLSATDKVIFVVDSDPQKPDQGFARPIPVELGVSHGDLVQILATGKDNLRPGQLVVIQGNERLNPKGQKVAMK